MKSPVRLIVLISAMALCLVSCNMFKKHHKEGRLTVDDGITVVNLYGSWHDMGSQYGRLAKEYLIDMLDFIDMRLGGDTSRTEEAYDIAGKLYSGYPEYLEDFFTGMSESSGISLERLILCNASEYIEGCFFCSAMAVWNEYSEGGLVFGRNYDVATFGEVDKDVIVTVYHPDDGLVAATIGYAGEIYCVNGFNEKGLFIELNNGMPSAGWDIHWEIRPSTSELFDLLFKAESMDDADDFFNSIRSASSFLIGVADSTEARLYEWCYDGARRSDVLTPDGLMVSTNHYVHPDWEYPIPSDADSWNSLARRANMLDRVEENKGKIDVETMKAIMSATIEGGGPYHPLTRYQLVVEPAEMTVHMKLSCNSGWSRIDLGQYLNSK
ncbi:MAG: C45 family peptidase [Bacteroidia bacterium]|nr:C45 family peptidase [Bacteroidia bacterium]